MGFYMFNIIHYGEQEEALKVGQIHMPKNHKNGQSIIRRKNTHVNLELVSFWLVCDFVDHRTWLALAKIAESEK